MDGKTVAGEEVDHCFSRMVTKLFIDYRNLTHLCSRHHGMKSSEQKAFSRVEKQTGMAKSLHEYVREREGAEWYDEAAREAGSHRAKIWDILELEVIETQYRQLLANGESNG